MIINAIALIVCLSVFYGLIRLWAYIFLGE